jgi:hypothetical protein
MGISSDGIVAFGFKLVDEEDGELPPKMTAYMEEDDEDGFDLYNFIAHETGTQDADYPVQEASRKAFPVDVVMFCSYDYPMYFLAVNGTVAKCSRGYATKFDPATPDIAALKAFCEKYEIEWQEPAWHVMSMYG